MPPLSTREKLSYASGEIASNLTWNMVAGFLLFYYTDVALLPVAALGTLMLVTRVLDAVFDPAVGLLVDRTRSKYGKARPYLLHVAIPFAIMAVATFSVPSGLSDGGKLVYAYVTFTILGLLYSLLYIPYSALLPMMTRNPADKVQLGSFRSMGTSIASIFVYGLTLPLVGWIGGDDEQLGFTVAAIVMVSITTALYFVVFFNCRERLSQDGGNDHAPAGKSLAQMSRNPIWRIVFAFALLIFVRIGVLVSSVAFFAKDVLGAPWMISVMLPMLSVALLLGGFLASFVFKRITKRRGNIIALAVSIVFLLMMPFAQVYPAAFIALFFLANVGGGIQGATTFIMLADMVEVHEARFGNRSEGLLVSSVSFGMKVGMAIGAAATGYALGFAGYDPEQATDTANRALSWLFYGAPTVLMLAQMVCIAFLREDRVEVAVTVSPPEMKGAQT